MRKSTPSNAPAPPSQLTGGNHPTRRSCLGAGLAWAGAALAGATGLAGCGGSDDSPATPAPAPQPPPAPAAPPTVVTPRAVTLRSGLNQPWGLAFLPDARMLVTERGGRLLLLSADAGTAQAVTGAPAVAFGGQGGLLDVALDPDFASDPWVYLSYAEPGTGAEAGRSGTAVARGRLVGTALQDVQVIFRQVPKVSGSGHFGARLVFRSDRTLFVTLGDRQLGSPAQDLAGTLGKVVRIHRDGSVPADNPGLSATRPEIWSLGHRNPQGAALRPGTDELWLNEHGPQGGDELNRVLAGGNHGWPLVSYGCNYGSPVGETCRLGGGTHGPTYAEPVSTWVPTSVAPAGLVFYTGTVFPQWRGHLLMGALAGQALWRVELDADLRENGRERLFAELNERIRDVRQAPDGRLLLLTDSGRLIQIRE
jgi:glucose/arabinose dehydrogenase